MLSLMLKEGEYLTIGEDIVVQAFPDSKSRVRLAVKAPKDVPILRGDLREKTGAQRPDGLVGPLAAEHPKRETKSVSSGCANRLKYTAPRCPSKGHGAWTERSAPPLCRSQGIGESTAEEPQQSFYL